MTVAFADPPPIHAAEAPAAAHCPLCASAAGAPAWTAADGLRAAYRCAGCGLTYVWPRLEQIFLNAPEEFYYHSFELLDFDGPDFLFADVSAALGRRVALGLDRAGAMPSILDAGCGAGHALLTFRAHGWQTEGVDPWNTVTAIGRKYYRLKLQDAKLETARIEPGSKDVVLAQDVLQFVGEPRAFLAAALATLRPGGLLYLTLPNWGSASVQCQGWGHAHFAPAAYLSYFTAETIRRLLDEAGFYRIQVTLYAGPEGDERLRVLARRAIPTALDWPDLAEEVPDAALPPLDRSTAAVASLSPEQAFWRENGYLILPELIPDELIDRYCAVRRRVSHAEGYHSETPYLDVPAIRDLCLYPPLSAMLTHLMGEEVGLQHYEFGSVSVAYNNSNYIVL